MLQAMGSIMKLEKTQKACLLIDKTPDKRANEIYWENKYE